MCGILGIYGFKDVSYDLISGLTSIQHRGQDSAGIVTFEDRFHIKKGLGLVSTVFKEKNFKRLKGHIGLGHVRYATQGTTEIFDAQPFAVNYPFGLAMVHNGNVINFNEIRETLYKDNHRLLDTSNDLELILYTFASELEKKNLTNLSINDIFESVYSTQKRIKGSYSTITIIANIGFLAFKDPYGIRPIVMGQKMTQDGPIYAFSSESTCFDYLGYELMHELEPGESIFIDKDRKIHKRICYQEKEAFCIFEYIYFAREDSIIKGNLIASERVKMGKMLAKKFRQKGLKPDIIIDVPSSAYFFASSLAEELGVPYRRGFAKNNHVGRSFIAPSQEEREQLVKQKLNPIRDIIKNKKVAVVDDSIVRGTTSKHIIKILRDAGAKEVYFVSASPPITCPCIYGIDMSLKTELIASRYTEDEIAKYHLGADALIYQSIEDLKELYKDKPSCFACFTGEYPTGISTDFIKDIELEKACAKRC